MRPLRYAAMTMVHREETYLALWLRHYEPMFGREHLYVILHGGDPRLAKLAAGCNLVHLPRLSVDNRFNAARFAFLNAYANFLLTQYDAVVSGDVDELVFVDPALGQSLQDFAESHRARAGILWTLGLNIIERPGDADLDLTQPILAQRRHARCEANYCKPLIAFRDPVWALGFHSAMAEPYLPDGLYMAHLHHFSDRHGAVIAGQRAETLAENPAIRASDPYRQLWWGERHEKSRRYLRWMQQKPVEAFDDKIPEVAKALRACVIPCNWGGPDHRQFSFAQRPEYILRLPDRFATLI